MHDRQFDELVGTLADPLTPRRKVLGALVVGALATALNGMGSESKAGRRRRRRRRRRRNARVCFKGREIVVNRTAARELVSRGATRGRCDVQGEPPGSNRTCENSKLPCDANPTFCGDSGTSCACFATTSGGSACSLNQFVCESDVSTCASDFDCTLRYGDGFSCVATTACGGFHCGGNGNACAPPCATCIRTGGTCGADVDGSCCSGAACDNGVCGDVGTPEPASCSAADPTCPPCQVCVENSICQPVPNGLLACDGSLLRPQSECTQQPRTGVCIDGTCNCGPGGEYDRSNNTCVCNAESMDQCGGCCQISFVCADGTTLTTCGTCAPE